MNPGEAKNQGNITSGAHASFWIDTSKPIIYERLNRAMECDVVVVGGGISGLTAAYNLMKAGKNVIVVEDGYVGSGESGRTTAHITYALDDRYFELENMFGPYHTNLAANSHMMALQWVDDVVKKENISCNFQRVPGYLFLSEGDKSDTLEKELAATRKAGIFTELIEGIPSIQGGSLKKCLKFPGQGQFHILKYLKGIADAIIRGGGKIFTETRAEDIKPEGVIANGFFIKADYIVVATNTPINNQVTMHTKQWPYRTYAIAGKIPHGSLPFSLWWDTGAMHSKWVAAPYHYIRIAEFDNKFDVLISGGEDHKVGQADAENIPEEDRYSRLTDWTKKMFPVFETVDYKWSGQVMEPVDSLAFIGKNPGDENIFIITGDSGNGMTHGTIGGIMISDMITGKGSVWTGIYNPSRMMTKAAGDFIREAGNMAGQYSQWLSKGDINKTLELQPGAGGMLSRGLKKYAVYRDESNKLHAFSGICPHLGGVLIWNADEKSFDCPVHGSRFAVTGEVLNGPAISGLSRVEIKDVSD